MRPQQLVQENEQEHYCSNRIHYVAMLTRKPVITTHVAKISYMSLASYSN